MAEQRPAFDPSKMKGTPPPAPAGDSARTVTVSQLNLMIKQVVGDHLPGTLHLRGEISNLSRPASGHLYMTLKDDRSEIRAVMWRSSVASIKFDPADGLEVIATGHVDHYQPRGQLQFYIRKLAPVGAGSLELAFRQLCEKLKKEGLFDTRHKQTLPRFPRRIGVITSDTGAAIRDILHTIRRRYPCVSVMLHPVRVQGEGAAAEIAAAIRRLNLQAERLGGIDVLIVGRGGGSLEDLWAFNEEVVARAIHASTIPIVSAVGHEVDISIADMVADVRAPTPTAAAELVTPVLSEELDMLASHAVRMQRAVHRVVERARMRFDHAGRFVWFRDPATALAHETKRVHASATRLRFAAAKRLNHAHRRIHEMQMALMRRQPREFVRRQDRRLALLDQRLWKAIGRRLHMTEHRLLRAETRLGAVQPARRLQQARHELVRMRMRLRSASQRLLRHHEEALATKQRLLDNCSYRKTLARGYTLTRRAGTRRIVTRADQVKPGDRVVTETAQGDFESRVLDTDQPELFD